MKILVLNAGSNSLKFECVEVSATRRWGRSLLAGTFDGIGHGQTALTLTAQKRVVYQEATTARTHPEAARALFAWLAEGHASRHGLSSVHDLDRIAHRVVHGAHRFGYTAPITAAVLDQIRSLEELAPLHNGLSRQIIETARELLGVQFPMVAVFDTAFHRTIPETAALYGLPLELARRHQIRRYGFHGISHQYLALRAAELIGRPVHELKLVTLHLEGGSSVAAIKQGQSVDTSMGFTPLEGLMMGTRSGDLDPAIALYLMRKEGWDNAAAEQFLNKACGLQGVSARSADTRELVQHLDDPAVETALNMFCYRVTKYVGAYLAALGGADALVFGGGIGENTPLIRSRVCATLGWCGAVVEETRNAQTVDREGCISVAGATLPVWVIPTQEHLMMAAHAAREDHLRE